MPIISGSGSSAASGRVVLFDSTLGANAASIDTGATGVAAGYNAISIYLIGRTTIASVDGGIFIRVNGDSGANYDQAFVGLDAGTTTSGTALAQTQWSLDFAGASMDANAASIISIVILSYDQTTFHKEGTILESGSSGTAGNNWQLTASCRWRNTAAISRVQALPSSGNLLAGTRLLVLGG
jgi:hypothetical protein